MGPLCFLLATLLSTQFVPTFPFPADDDFLCDCDYCNDENRNDTEMEVNIWDTEDFDGDGNRTICARDRDVREDQSFSSICHMHCHNKCTRSRITMYMENKIKKYIATVSRTNFYKLKDGPC